MRPKILIVDDEPKMCRTLEILLSENGRYDIMSAYSAKEALPSCSRDTDLVITDLSMEGMDGISLLKDIKARSPDTQVILMTAYSSVRSAIEAMKSGACEYLVKPFENDEFLAVVDRALEVNRLRRENTFLREETIEQYPYRDIVGQSPAMQKVFSLMENTRENDSTVFITGESGTGKELVARAIHFTGDRASGPFVPINCTALPETLLESEVFGYEKGAFSGALRTTVGKFERAHRGTAFLDEIGEMSPVLQVKLLRFLQEKEFERVGGTSPIKVNVRIIAATNSDISRAIAEGRFREDLYYRLNVIHIEIPPLRERKEDIPLLLDHFLAVKAQKLGIPRKGLSPEARELLISYEYPGNVRELENIIERALITSSGPSLTPADMDLKPHTGPPSVPGPGDLGRLFDTLGIAPQGGWMKLQGIVSALERLLLTRTLKEWGSLPNERIASLLGTSRRILELRIRELGLSKDKKSS